MLYTANLHKEPPEVGLVKKLTGSLYYWVIRHEPTLHSILSDNDTEHTGLTLCLRQERVLHPHLSNAYQASPYDPHSCTESCGWSRRRPSEQLPASKRLDIISHGCYKNNSYFIFMAILRWDPKEIHRRS